MNYKRYGAAKTQALVLFLCSVSFISCAEQPLLPRPLSDDIRVHLGKVGIVPGRFVPEGKFGIPAAGASEGATRGAMAGGRTSVRAGAIGGGFAANAPVLGATALALGIALAPVTAIVGGIHGAIAAESIDTVESAEAVLRKTLAEARLQEVMRDHVVQIARDEARHLLAVPAEALGPSDANEATSYQFLTSQGIDSIIEISVLSMTIEGEWSVNPPLNFRLAVRARVVSTHENSVIYNNRFEYEGATRPFTEWAANNAQPLREEFERSYDTLAAQIVEDLFLLELLPEVAFEGWQKQIR